MGVATDFVLKQINAFVQMFLKILHLQQYTYEMNVKQQTKLRFFDSFNF